MSIGAGPMMSKFPYGFANGLSVRGVPLVQTHPGRAFWVYNGTNLSPQGRAGSDNNRGSFDSPFATIAGALAQCVASRGDVVFVKPGHAETISAASGINLSVAGVAVIGLGSGNLRPTLTFSTSANASLMVSAAQCSLINFLIDCTSFAALNNPVQVQAADFQMIGTRMRLANATNQAVLGVLTTAAADRMVVDGCQFTGTTDAGTTTALQIVGGDLIQITNNYFYGAYTTTLGAINNVTTAMTEALVSGNVISNATASSTKAMVFVAGSTGSIANNRMQILSGTAPITGAGMSWVGGNYYAAAAATAGTLI